MHLEFFGAAGEVTGSCQPFPFAASRVDAAGLSHARIGAAA